MNQVGFESTLQQTGQILRVAVFSVFLIACGQTQYPIDGPDQAKESGSGQGSLEQTASVVVDPEGGSSTVDGSVGTDGSSVGNSSVGNSSVGNSSVGNSSVSGSSVGGSSVGGSSVGGSSVAGSSAGNSSAGAPPPLGAANSNNRVAIPDFGAYIGMNTGDDANGVTIEGRERLLGQKMAIERIFYPNRSWTLDRININQVINSYVNGRIPMVSYKVGAWKDITAGNSDAIIDKLAGLIKESGIPMLLTFHHEAENNACVNANPNCGRGQTAQDYVDMWRHIHNRFSALEVDNVSWNWIVMGWQWGPGGNDNVRNHIESMFPGVDYVDWISADLYNMAGDCSLSPQEINSRWRDLGDEGQGWYDWASQFSKPLALAEWGTFDDRLVDGRKAQWLRNAGETLKRWTNIKAVTYFDRDHLGCDWRIDTGGNIELNGYRDLINDPYFIKGE